MSTKVGIDSIHQQIAKVPLPHNKPKTASLTCCRSGPKARASPVDTIILFKLRKLQEIPVFATRKCTEDSVK